MGKVQAVLFHRIDHFVLVIGGKDTKVHILGVPNEVALMYED